jgi:hypothetical protein
MSFDFASKAAVEAATITAGTDFIRIAGYYAPADGGGALYRFVASEPTHAGKIHSSDGAWWEIDFSQPLAPEAFGARADGTNDRTYVQAAIDALYAHGGGTLRLSSKRYTVSGLSSNGLSVLIARSGVNWEGSGEVSEIFLADNTNVVDSQFSATFAPTSDIVSGSITGTTLTVAGGATVRIGAVLSGTGVASGTTVTALLGAGQYSVSISQSVASTGITETYCLMTVVGAVVGSIVRDQFLSNPSLAPVTLVKETLGVGLYQVSTMNSLGTAIAVKGCNRFVDLIGNHDPDRLDVTSFRNFYLNYNGQNNCAGGTIWTFNSVMAVNSGSHLIFHQVKFRNNSGSNTLVLGYPNPTVANVTISECSFGFDGDRINPASVDYSTIFIDAVGAEIVANQFNGGPVLNGAAFEVYGSNINIVGNNVRDYFNGANIVALEGQTTANVNVTGNAFLDVNAGIVLWARKAGNLWGVNISGNVFRGAVTNPLASPFMVRGLAPEVDPLSDLRNISIQDNVYQQFATDTSLTGAGISLQNFYTAKISNNLIYGVPGPGVYITNALVGGSLDITNNQLVNTGYTATTGAGLKTGVTLDASATLATLNISGNAVNPISGYTLEYGIKNALAATHGLIGDNLIHSATTAVSNTGAGVAYRPAGVPSFQARRGGGNQTGVVPGVFTKVQLNVEEWDAGNYYDNTTNFRFTPLIAGKYQVNFQVTLLLMNAGIAIMVEVRKNGTGFKRGRNVVGGANTGGVSLSCLVDMNGSTDYMEFFVYHEDGANRDIRGDNTTETYASAVWVGP